MHLKIVPFDQGDQIVWTKSTQAIFPKMPLNGTQLSFFTKGYHLVLGLLAPYLQRSSRLIKSDQILLKNLHPMTKKYLNG